MAKYQSPPLPLFVADKYGGTGQRCSLGIFPFPISISQQGLGFFPDNLGYVLLRHLGMKESSLLPLYLVGVKRRS